MYIRAATCYFFLSFLIIFSNVFLMPLFSTFLYLLFADFNISSSKTSDYHKQHTDGRQLTKGKDAYQLQVPEDIVCKITQRNNIIRANTCDPVIKLLNEEITSDIQKHKQTYGRSTYTLIGITGTTHTLFGRPYMVYPTEHHHTH